MPAARAFYAAVLGDVPIDVVALPPQAVARGARPHWLGFIGVDDVAATTAAFIARGASPLGPALKDPGGAVVALGPRAPAATAPAAYQLLHTPDVQRARADYGALFGWAFGAPEDRGPHGVFHPFAWTAGGPTVGAMVDLAGRTGIHPHWLFHFRVPALGPAVEAARAAGATIAGVFSNETIAVCDDPQGAAFALRSA